MHSIVVLHPGSQFANLPVYSHGAFASAYSMLLMRCTGSTCRDTAFTTAGFWQAQLETDMSSISICRRHSLPHARAIEVANSVAAGLKTDHGVQSRWQESTMHFERTGLTGTLTLSPHRLQIKVKLGFLLAVFRDSIAKAIEQKLDDEFAAKPLRAKRSKPSRT